MTLREKIEIDPQKLTGAATSLGKGVMTGTPMEGNKTNLSDFNGYGLPQDKLPGLTEAQVRAFYARVYRQLVDRLGKGTGDLSQYFIFWDLRTGMIETNAVKVNQSGFNSHIVMEKVGGKYFIELKKTPNANNGVEAGIMDAAAQNSIQDEVKP